MKELNDYIEALKITRKKTELDVSDEIVFEQAIKVFLSDRISNSHRQEKIKKSTNFSPATDKQKNLLKKMKIKFNEDISKSKASKLIDDKLKK